MGSKRVSRLSLGYYRTQPGSPIIHSGGASFVSGVQLGLTELRPASPGLEGTRLLTRSGMRTGEHAHADPGGQLLRLNCTGTLNYAATDARSFPRRFRGAGLFSAIHAVTLSIVSDRGARPRLMR